MGASWSSLDTSSPTCKYSWSGSKALRCQASTLLTADVFSELGAQLNLTKKPNRKWYHTCRHVLMPSHVKSVTAVCLSSTVGKEGCCRGFQALQFCENLQKSGDSQAQRAVVKPAITDHIFKKWVPDDTAGSCSTRRQTARWKDEKGRLFHFT